MTNNLPHGWTESRPGALACNADPELGGIIDRTIKTGEWFVIFNSDHIATIDGLPTREAAFEAYSKAINKTYWLA